MDDHDTKPPETRFLSRPLPTGADAPAMGREAVGDMADILPPDLIRDAQLLVSDLVAHRVRRLPPSAGTLELGLSVTEQRLRVEVVHDDRSSIQPTADPSEPQSGWDLHAVAELADRWGIRRDRLTTVWFELDR